jgi:hypothetical protein
MVINDSTKTNKTKQNNKKKLKQPPFTTNHWAQKTIAFSALNLSSGLGQSHKCGGVKHAD